jgi:hypothetical protein
VTCAERLPGKATSGPVGGLGRTKSEAIRRKSFKVRETTSLLCPPKRLVQTHKLSMVIEAMIYALQRVCESRLERAKFRCGV